MVPAREDLGLEFFSFGSLRLIMAKAKKSLDKKTKTKESKSMKIPAKAAAKKAPAKAAKKASVKAASKKMTESRLAHMDDKILDQIIIKLRELREESLEIVSSHMMADLKANEENIDVGDDMDQASSERDREFSLIIHQRHLQRLKQLDKAYERIDEGTYGLCEGTEEPINPKRLLIMPLTRFSLEYQQQQEKMLGRSPDSGVDNFDDTPMTDE